MSSPTAAEARAEAWITFVESDLFRLVMDSNQSEHGTKCVFDAGFNAGLRAALEFLSLHTQ